MISRETFFDIETIPSAATLAMDPPQDFLDKGIQKNWKVDTIVAHQEKQALVWPNERIKYGSVDWRMGEILCVGLGYWTSEPTPTLKVSVGYRTAPLDGVKASDIPRPTAFDSEVGVTACADEASLLGWFWQELNVRPVAVGFASRNFDLPWLLFRSAINGVEVGRRFNTMRYGIWGSNVDFIDMADLLNWYGAFNATGWTLERYCEHFDLPAKPRGKGEDVFELFREGRHIDVATHQAWDIFSTAALYDRLRPIFRR